MKSEIKDRLADAPIPRRGLGLIDMTVTEEDLALAEQVMANEREREEKSRSYSKFFHDVS